MMLEFRRAIQGTVLTNWQIINGRALSFGRGDRGHILINTGEQAITVSAPTALATGRYADLLSGRNVQVTDDGLVVVSLEPQSVVAILADTK